MQLSVFDKVRDCSTLRGRINQKIIMQLVLVLFFTALNHFSIGQNSKLDCSSLKAGTYKYLDIEDTTAYFEINKASHIEYHQSGKYQIKSKLEWLNDCKYAMTMLSSTVPGFPFKPGDIMVVIITKREENIIYYTAEVNKQIWTGRLLKIN